VSEVESRRTLRNDYSAWERSFPGRILLFDEESARMFAKIHRQREAGGRPIAELDAMLAAIARSRKGLRENRLAGESACATQS
jgi:predicted nucleic acid-binding protein